MLVPIHFILDNYNLDGSQRPNYANVPNGRFAAIDSIVAEGKGFPIIDIRVSEIHIVHLKNEVSSKF